MVRRSPPWDESRKERFRPALLKVWAVAAASPGDAGLSPVCDKLSIQIERTFQCNHLEMVTAIGHCHNLRACDGRLVSL